MKIKTFLDKSQVHGIGLFCSEDVKKGNIIYKPNENLDLKLQKKEFDALEKEEQDYILHYGYRNKEEYHLSFDNIRFCNHSRNCNNISKKVTGNSFTLYAICNIKKGEELLQNYSEFEELRQILS